MKRRRRLRIFTVALGIFVALVACAAVLLRLGQPDVRENFGAPAPAATGSSDQAGQTTSAVGGARDEAGATSAALTYAAAPQGWLYLSDEEIVEAVTVVATPVAADRLSGEVVDEVRVARDSLAESPGPVWWIVRPLAWRVESFADTRATVSVWTVSVLSAADVAMPQAEWAITTLQLEWTDGAWRVADVTDTVGPTPAVGPADLPWEPEPFADTLEGFTRIGEEQPR